MRDLAILVIVLGSLPFILRSPAIGVLIWSWLSYMNPHRLAWGFAYDFPFAQIVAITLLLSILFTREPKRVPMTDLTVIWLLFIAWMGITTIFAFFPDAATEQFVKVIKIQFVTFICLMIMGSKDRINLLIWVIVVSIGFFGVKGGVFTILTAGNFRVYGPSGSFIEDNNTLATALLMIVPLMRYLQTQANKQWIKLGLLGAICLTILAVFSSHSRGALLASFAMAGFLWLKSKGSEKIILAIAILLAVPLLFAFMPESWHARMGTIEHYEQDQSAMGRINAWTYSFNVANHRLTGAGFESWSPMTFALYAPDPYSVHAAHSIYFGVLGDHGWPGLVLFLLILLLAWRTGSWIIRNSSDHIELGWVAELARMIQVSLVAYWTGGAFLSLAYYDLPWHLIAILVLSKVLVRKHLDEIASGARDSPSDKGDLIPNTLSKSGVGIPAPSG